MPREDRRITFDYAEVYKAIFTLCVKKEMRRPPAGAIQELIIKPEDEQTIVVKIDNIQENSVSNNEYSRDFLAAALMFYCRSCEIPLPKKGLKWVEVGSDNVTLRVSI